MTEEQEQIEPEITEQETVHEPEKESEQEVKEEANGTEFVDLDELPPAAQKRFKRIYAHMKENERALEESGKVNKQLYDRLRKIEENSNTSQRETKIAAIKSQLKDAIESGDVDRQVELNGELQKTYATNTEPEPIEMPESAVDLNARKLESMAAEVDDDGNMKRPWMQQTHPRFQEAVSAANAVMYSPEYQGHPIEDIMEEVDRRMISKKRTAPQVLDSAENKGPKKDSTELTSEQKLVAKAMGLSEKEYMEGLKNA